jgi:PAS domain S-box-containing protein
MADNIVATSKLLTDISQVLNGTQDNIDIPNNFAGLVTSLFGIDKATVTEIKEEANSAVCEYISNTKKAYVDNQLSEFSAFPELIGHKNAGYRSYAAIPILVDGKVSFVLEMLSNFENKFSPDMMQILSLGTPLLGYALMYRKEKGKNLKLATYFDAAFSDSAPQLLVSSSGNIIKANKSAMKKLNLSLGAEIKVAGALGLDFAALSSLSKGSSTELVISGYAEPSVYNVTVSKISESMLHVLLIDSTSSSILKSTLTAMDYSEDMAVVLVDNDFIIKQASKGFSQFLGYPQGMVTGKSLLDMLDQRGRALIGGEDGRIKPDSSSIIAGTVQLLTGNSTLTRAHIVMARSFSGAVVAVSKASFEEYVDIASENLNDFVSTTSDVVIKIDSLGFIKECNLATEHVLGYTKEELLNKDVKMLYEDPAMLDRDIAYAKNGGKVDSTYVNLFKKDRATIPVTHYVRMLKGNKMDEYYLILIKELATKQLLVSQDSIIKENFGYIKKLEGNSELKSEFIYNISHELKTPLTSIIGFSKFLYGGEFGQLNDEQRDNIKTIIDEADRLMLIINQILDATKLDANKVELDFKEVDLAELKNSPSITALEEAAQKKGVQFSWTVKYDTPKIMADQNRLIQVFVNLIGNAIKFTESGSITVNIENKSKNKIVVSVKDTGMGISPEDKQKLFRKFYQVPRKGLVKPEGTGTGLGLSITRDIIKLHHGKIKVDSEVGKGSNFWFILPIIQRQPRKKQHSQTA